MTALPRRAAGPRAGRNCQRHGSGGHQRNTGHADHGGLARTDAFTLGHGLAFKALAYASAAATGFGDALRDLHDRDHDGAADDG